jgi:hypothetical protein
MSGAKFGRVMKQNTSRAANKYKGVFHASKNKSCEAKQSLAPRSSMSLTPAARALSSLTTVVACSTNLVFGRPGGTFRYVTLASGFQQFTVRLLPSLYYLFHCFLPLFTSDDFPFFSLSTSFRFFPLTIYLSVSIPLFLFLFSFLPFSFFCFILHSLLLLLLPFHSILFSSTSFYFLSSLVSTAVVPGQTQNCCTSKSRPATFMQAPRKKGRKLVLILDLGTRWGSVVSVTSRPRFTPGDGPPVPIEQEAGWAPEPVWTQRLEQKSFASAGNRTPVV